MRNANGSRICFALAVSMRQLRIGETVLQVKDYDCSQDETYLPKTEPRLWLYVNLTSGCNAACPFCVNPSSGAPKSIDTLTFASTLEQIEPIVYGISFTGGEPMLDIGLLEEAIKVVGDGVGDDVELDLVTNGTNLGQLSYVRGLERFATIHVSRHAADDDANRRLMRWQGAPSLTDLASCFASLPDRGSTVLNCVLQRGGVEDHSSAVEYLEMASGIGAANVSFIRMIEANGFCRENGVSPSSLGLDSDERFSIWNSYHDHDFCQCSTGDYRVRNGYVRLYYRCPSNVSQASYCRQLVYGADNVLRQGFGDAPVVCVGDSSGMHP